MCSFCVFGWNNSRLRPCEMIVGDSEITLPVGIQNICVYP